MVKQLYLERYSPIGDLTVVSVCLVMITLIFFSYTRKSRSFGIFVSLLGLLVLSALAQVSFYSLAASSSEALYTVASGMRCLHLALLFTIFLLYVVYIGEVTQLSRRQRRPFHIATAVIYVVIIGLDVLDTVLGRGLQITPTTIAYQGPDRFIYGYIAFLILIIAMMIRVRKLLYKRVMFGFYSTMVISVAVLMVQRLCGQSSYTVATFMYPVIAMFYFMHSTPYDASLGAIDSKLLEDMVRYNCAKHREFMFMSLYMRDFDEEGKIMPESIKAVVRRFTVDFFRDATLFQIGNGHMILMFLKKRNLDYESKIVRILRAFRYEYQKFGYDYKIVIGESVEEISRKNEYVSFINNIYRGMEENTIHRVTEDDVRKFSQIVHVLRELEDIYRKRDLDDPRVLAYCQPVYNLRTRRYDTAEALMRLKLDGSGLVFPDVFIPLAEEYGYIHVLTQIILHKTCQEIRRLMTAGYTVTRVSVNVSVPELKDDDFCSDIIHTIDNSGIPGEKIAIELTESRSDADFMLMQEKITQLRQRGIKFYLDDFGTGYSNMERILELPFDIIKFDRSMVQASGSSERSRRIVNSLASMFSQLDYAVLYEGVEEAEDERMCAAMCASYLQGYKYSRPVPIETLTDFFEREAG